MTTSVATKPTKRAETDPAILAAQQQRLPQLRATVNAGSMCSSKAPGIPAPDDWYRGDGEPIEDWRQRKAQLRAVCAACPVQPACEESALRQGEGSDRMTDDMVRAGRSGPELYAAREAQADRLTTAKKKDDQARSEEQALRVLFARLRAILPVEHTRLNRERNNTEIRTTIHEITGITTPRRARAGWNTSNAA